MSNLGPLVDQFQRRITYLRLSVTDRCDLRCSYCMPERQTFLPRAEVLPTADALLSLAPALLAAGRAVPAEQALPLYIRDKVAQTTAERAAAGLAR